MFEIILNSTKKKTYLFPTLVCGYSTKNVICTFKLENKIKCMYIIKYINQLIYTVL